MYSWNMVFACTMELLLCLCWKQKALVTLCLVSFSKMKMDWESLQNRNCWKQLVLLFSLWQLWTLYCDQTKSPGELSTHAASIVMEFWGKVTPGILHLLTQAKEVRSLRIWLYGQGFETVRAFTVLGSKISYLSLKCDENFQVEMCLPIWLTIIFYDQFLSCSTSTVSILGNKEVTYNLSRLEVMCPA